MRNLSSLGGDPRHVDKAVRGAGIAPIALAAMLSACSFPRPEDPNERPGKTPDGGTAADAVGMQADGPPCIPGYVDLCGLSPRTDSLTVTGNQEINTGNDPRCTVKVQTGGPDLCILYFTKVEIPVGSGLVAYGSRALVLASSTTITIGGVLDVGSRRSRLDKPGAGSGNCAFGAQAETDPGGGGGGAGGTLSSQGGNGGIGDQNDSNAAGGVANGGLPGSPMGMVPLVLRGGCAGQNGGNGVGIGGVGGLGGGGVYLFAKGAINIAGGIAATGSGGGAGANRAGGGGGGSGGTIVIESQTQSALAGIFLATGGGGGEGAGLQAGQADPGSDPPSTPAAAAGGARDPEGGNGGNGATTAGATVTPAGNGAISDGGGGGGGGGNGYIVVRGANRMLTGTFAPFAVQP